MDYGAAGILSRETVLVHACGPSGTAVVGWVLVGPIWACGRGPTRLPLYSSPEPWVPGLKPGFRSVSHWSGQPVAHRKACRPTHERTPRRRVHSEPVWCHRVSCLGPLTASASRCPLPSQPRTATTGRRTNSTWQVRHAQPDRVSLHHLRPSRARSPWRLVTAARSGSATLPSSPERG